jgi:hypothetical protein
VTQGMYYISSSRAAPVKPVFAASQSVIYRKYFILYERPPCSVPSLSLSSQSPRTSSETSTAVSRFRVFVHVSIVSVTPPLDPSYLFPPSSVQKMQSILTRRPATGEHLLASVAPRNGPCFAISVQAHPFDDTPTHSTRFASSPHGGESDVPRWTPRAM